MFVRDILAWQCENKIELSKKEQECMIVEKIPFVQTLGKCSSLVHVKRAHISVTKSYNSVVDLSARSFMLLTYISLEEHGGDGWSVLNKMTSHNVVL
jgi:hypothetical protein